MKTPRTDAEGVRFARLMIEWPEPGKQKTTELVPADFARELERENAKLRAALIQCRNASDDTEIHAMIDALIY